MECKEIPALNVTDSFVPDIEQDIKDPLFGGTGKLTFSLIEDNYAKFKCVTPSYGTLEWTERYDEKGFTKDIKGRNGASYVEFWSRTSTILDFTIGEYTDTKEQNFADFLVAIGENINRPLITSPQEKKNSTL